MVELLETSESEDVTIRRNKSLTSKPGCLLLLQDPFDDPPRALKETRVMTRLLAAEPLVITLY